MKNILILIALLFSMNASAEVWVPGVVKCEKHNGGIKDVLKSLRGKGFTCSIFKFEGAEVIDCGHNGSYFALNTERECLKFMKNTAEGLKKIKALKEKYR